jgi:phosphopantothenate---cysteine ligase (CTP)
VKSAPTCTHREGISCTKATMECVVTAGPTAEALDRVRCLTNISTGRLGVELANHLTRKGHAVTLLRGERATWAGKVVGAQTETFHSTSDLRRLVRKMGRRKVAAVFHAAAVSDFTFGRVWKRQKSGKLTSVKSGKYPTRGGGLLAELVPTTKIIAGLRGCFPRAVLVGWKYEVDGNRTTAIKAAKAQVAAYRTDACVANGPAYGKGFGLVTKAGRCEHFEDRRRLFGALERFTRQRSVEALGKR